MTTTDSRNLLLSLSSGVMLAMVTVIFSLSFLSSPHFSLSTSSIPGLQRLLSCTVVLHCIPTLSRSLLPQSSHRILDLLHLVFPPFSGHLVANVLSPIHSTCPAHVSLLLTSFFIKRSFTPTSTLSSFSLLLFALFAPAILLIQCSQTCTFSSCFCVNAIVSKPSL